MRLTPRAHYTRIATGKGAVLHDLNSHILLRLMLAAFLGGLIGLERQLRGKPAGIRANVLICFDAQATPLRVPRDTSTKARVCGGRHDDARQASSQDRGPSILKQFRPAR
jgi:hypothetical protein